MSEQEDRQQQQHRAADAGRASGSEEEGKENREEEEKENSEEEEKDNSKENGEMQSVDSDVADPAMLAYTMREHGLQEARQLMKGASNLDQLQQVYNDVITKAGQDEEILHEDRPPRTVQLRGPMKARPSSPQAQHMALMAQEQ